MSVPTEQSLFRTISGPAGWQQRVHFLLGYFSATVTLTATYEWRYPELEEGCSESLPI
jgi:hypothetical protein